MNQIIILFFLLFFRAMTMQAQELHSFRGENGKYGFKNLNGQEIIHAKYEEVYEFSEGLAAVKTGDYPNQKWGYINEKGQFVIPAKYFSANDFSNGLAAVSISSTEEFWGLVEEWIFIDKAGNQAFDQVFDRMAGISFNEGLCRIIRVETYSEEYEDEREFDASGRGFFIGYINEKGEQVIPSLYNQAEDFNEGIAKVAMGNRHGFIDKTGKQLFPFIECSYIEGNGKTFKEEGKVQISDYDPENDEIIEYYIDIKGNKVQ